MPVSKHRAARTNSHATYRKGYQKGLLDALHALVADFDDVEYVPDGDGGERSAQCYGCLLKARGYDALADHFRHVMGVDCD